MTRSSSEAGFTLVELLLGIAILTIIVSVLAAGTITGLRVQDQTVVAATRVIDEQLVGTLWSTDVQSATTIPTLGSPVPSCGSGDLTSAEALVSMSTGTAPAVRSVTWYWHSVPAPDGTPQQRLSRVTCPGSSGLAPDGHVLLGSPVTDRPVLGCDVGPPGAEPVPTAWGSCGELGQVRALRLTFSMTAAADTITERTTTYHATRRAG